MLNATYAFLPMGLLVSGFLYINEEGANISTKSHGVKKRMQQETEQKSLQIGWRAGFKFYSSLETLKVAWVLVVGKEGFIHGV